MMFRTPEPSLTVAFAERNWLSLQLTQWLCCYNSCPDPIPTNQTPSTQHNFGHNINELGLNRFAV
jgi:hypothetical protein